MRIYAREVYMWAERGWGVGGWGSGGTSTPVMPFDMFPAFPDFINVSGVFNISF